MVNKELQSLAQAHPDRIFLNVSVVIFALRVANAVIHETSLPNSGSEITFHFATREIAPDEPHSLSQRHCRCRCQMEIDRA